MTTRIHLERIGKPPRILDEESLLIDDGIRLVTYSSVPEAMAADWSRNVWQKQGLIAEGQVIRGIRKRYFYQEWFDIMELTDGGGSLLGYYCDIATPLQKRGDEFYLLDLLLDLWIWPDGRFLELDWDEFSAAKQNQLLTLDQSANALYTMNRLVEETRQGRFPKSYL